MDLARSRLNSSSSTAGSYCFRPSTLQSRDVRASAAAFHLFPLHNPANSFHLFQHFNSLRQHTAHADHQQQQLSVTPPWTTSIHPWQQHQHFHPHAHVLVTIAVSEHEQQLHQQLEALQHVLQIPFHRCHKATQQEPAILDFEPQTLRLTIDTLCEILNLNYHTVVGIIEQRPGILLAPDEPVYVQHQLSVLMGVTPLRVSNLLGSKYAHVLALTPQELEHRCLELCDVFLWLERSGAANTSSSNRSRGVHPSAHMASCPPSYTAQQLTALAAAVDCTDTTAVAAVVQHYPLLLDRRDYLIWPQLKLLADTAEVTPQRLVSELDSEQCHGLAGVLLYELGWIQAQLRAVDALLEQQQVSSGQMIVWMLVRLSTPDRLERAQVCMSTLQHLVSSYEPWQTQLRTADDRHLSMMLTATSEALQHLQFLVATGREAVCGMPLLEVLSCPVDDFRQKYGAAFEEWLRDMQNRAESAASRNNAAV